MGVVQRQAVKSSIVRVVASVVGVLSTVLVYSQFKSYQGFYNSYLFGAGSLLAVLMLIGGPNVAIRFHPRNAGKEFQGILSLQFLIVGILAFFFFLIALVFGDSLVNIFWRNPSSEDPRVQYYLWIIPFAVFFATNPLLTNYISSYQRIVMPTIINSLFPKIALATLVLLIGFAVIDYDTFVYLLFAMNAVTFSMLLGYLLFLDRRAFSGFSFASFKSKFRQIFAYGAFSMLNQLSAKLATRIDALMVAVMMGLMDAGAYFILLTLVGLIEQFSQSLFQITGPVVAKLINEGRMDQVKKTYQSSSMVLTIMSIFLGSLIVLNIHDIIDVLPKGEEFQNYFWVCVFLCLSHVINCSTSINSHIIVYSRYYRISLYILLGMGVINVFLNYLFIPVYGLAGASLSTLISWAFVNIARTVYVWWRFKIWPFSHRVLWVLIVFTAVFSLCFWIPMTSHAWFNLFIRSAIFSILFVLPLYFIGVSSEFNELINDNLAKVRRFFR